MRRHHRLALAQRPARAWVEEFLLRHFGKWVIGRVVLAVPYTGAIFIGRWSSQMVVMWVLSAYFLATTPLLWLMLRLVPMLELLRRPATWLFLSSRFLFRVSVSWRGWETDRAAPSTAESIAILMLLSLLLLVDALPQRLAQPYGRYGCPMHRRTCLPVQVLP